MSQHATRIDVRVYYEDTDFSGRVYHASYVRFLERGRTEWLRDLGFAHPHMSSLEMAFTVTRLEIDFRGAAFIDDALEIVTTLEELRGPVIAFRQTVSRQGAILAEGLVRVVALKNGRAARMPRELQSALASRDATQRTPPSP